MADSKSVAKGLRWTKERANKARDAAAFIHVTASGDGKQGLRKLSGAEKTWKKASNAGKPTDDAYDLENRLVGTPQDIRTALRAAGFTERNVDAAVSRLVDYRNFGLLSAGRGERSLQAAFDAEMGNAARIRGRKLESSKYDGSITLETWAAIAAGNPALGTVTYSGESKSSPRSGRGGQPKKTLSERLASLEAGKVLDVSKLTETGANAKAINAPKEASRSTKVGLSDPRYSKLVSDNAKTLKSALIILKAPASTVDSVDVLYGSTGRKEKSKAAPKKKTTKPKAKVKSPKPKSPKVQRASSPSRSAATDVKSQPAPTAGSLYQSAPSAPASAYSPRQRYAGTAYDGAGTGVPSGFGQTAAPPPAPRGSDNF